MPAPAGRSEPISLSSQPVSVAVNEHVAARRLGLSVDTLRRDRRLGHLGIPFIKLGTGKHGVVRYDLADLDRFLEGKKRIARAAAPQLSGSPVAQSEPLAVQPEQQAEPRAPEPGDPEPTVPLMPCAPTRPRTMWDALAEHVCREDPPDDPFAAVGRSAPRRQGSGYWGH